jgi:hypothetical protein
VRENGPRWDRNGRAAIPRRTATSANARPSRRSPTTKGCAILTSGGLLVGDDSVGGLLEPSKSRSALATGRPCCVIARRTELTRRRMSHTAGPRTCKGAALVSWSFATPQRIGADDKSGPASHLTLNRLAGVLTHARVPDSVNCVWRCCRCVRPFRTGCPKINMALSRNVLTPSPAHGQCCHSSLARLSVAVARGTIRSTSTLPTGAHQRFACKLNGLLQQGCGEIRDSDMFGSRVAA